jgi:hypothetical protein
MDYTTVSMLSLVLVLLVAFGYRRWRKAHPPAPTWSEAMAYLDEQMKNPKEPTPEELEASLTAQREELRKKYPGGKVSLVVSGLPEESMKRRRISMGDFRRGSWDTRRSRPPLSIRWKLFMNRFRSASDE